MHKHLGGIPDPPPITPTVARLTVDPYQPTRLRVVDPLRDQLRIPLLLLHLNPARRRPSPVPHRNLQSRVGVATSAGIRPYAHTSISDRGATQAICSRSNRYCNSHARVWLVTVASSFTGNPRPASVRPGVDRTDRPSTAASSSANVLLPTPCAPVKATRIATDGCPSIASYDPWFHRWSAICVAARGLFLPPSTGTRYPETVCQVLVEGWSVVLADGDNPDNAGLEGSDHAPPSAQVLAAVARPTAIGRKEPVAGGTTALGLQFWFQPSPILGRLASESLNGAISGRRSAQLMLGHELLSVRRTRRVRTRVFPRLPSPGFAGRDRVGRRRAPLSIAARDSGFAQNSGHAGL